MHTRCHLKLHSQQSLWCTLAASYVHCTALAEPCSALDSHQLVVMSRRTLWENTPNRSFTPAANQSQAVSTQWNNLMAEYEAVAIEVVDTEVGQRLSLEFGRWRPARRTGLCCKLLQKLGLAVSSLRASGCWHLLAGKSCWGSARMQSWPAASWPYTGACARMCSAAMAALLRRFH